jgi:hypothetical protein
MADFYPLLLRAVSQLAVNDPPERQDLYDHARKILAAQLRRLDPLPSASAIIHEHTALESAIRQLEAELTVEHSYSLIETELRQQVANGGTNGAIGRPGSIHDNNLDDDFSDLPTGGADLSSFSNERTAPPRLIEEFGELNGTAEIHQSAIEWNAPLSARLATPEPIPHKTFSLLHAGEANRPLVGPNGIAQPPTRRKIYELSSDRDAVSTDQGGRPNAHTRDKFHDVGARKKPAVLFLVSAALTAAMITFVAIVCVPLVLLHISRLVWFSEHLFDHPTPLVVTTLVFTLLLLLILPIFQTRRRKAAIGSLWRSLGLHAGKT